MITALDVEMMDETKLKLATRILCLTLGHLSIDTHTCIESREEKRNLDAARAL